MTALPRRLAAWAEPLGAFADEAQLAFGPWLAALERLLGPDGRDAADDHGEPNGFDGLGRRGRYERLALSEWALLDVAPEEFIRRAAAAEHLFHQVARIKPAGGGRVVVLFDAGPLQLGAPRLGHIAWLLVLSRRAQRRAVELVWGVLQKPELVLRKGGDAASIRALLAARSSRVAGPDAIAAWAAQLGRARGDEERWLIAAAIDRRAEDALGARGLAVAEPDVPGERSLRVQVSVAGGTRNQTALALPEADACARLLRDPFRADPGAAPEGGKAEDNQLASGAQILFAVSGNQLLARLRSGELVTLHFLVPRGGQNQTLRPMVRILPPPGKEVIAAGWRWGRMYIATAADDGVELRFGKRSRWHHPTTCRPRIEAPRPTPSQMLLSPLIVDRGGNVYWFCDAVWRLHQGSLDGGKLSVVAEGVLACGWSNEGLVSIERSGGALMLVTRGQRGVTRTHLFDGTMRASAAYIALDGHGRVELVAVSAGDGRWSLRATSGAIEEVDVGLDTLVFGASMVRGKPCLLVRGRGGHHLDFVHGAKTLSSLYFPAEVEHACIQPVGNLIAAQVGGALHVVPRTGQAHWTWGGPRP